uniref:glycerophosphodiester phosphodiesterase n=1 Tax=Salix viminalis TaxID=40686 RepID=A0A6N2MVR1_SALVM
MALQAVHVCDVHNLDHVPDNASLSLYSTRFSKGVELNREATFKMPKFMVVGHRGNGMNVLQSTDGRMKEIKENSIMSFNSAAKHPIDFIEFDVQKQNKNGIENKSMELNETKTRNVTKDDCPVIFHDNFILYEDNGTVFEKRVTELCLSEFLCFGPQKEAGRAGRSLLRKDGKIVEWKVEKDDSLCSLQDAFQQVESSLGFNIELKFDDHIVYQQDYLTRVLQAILQVYFLTNGGTEIFYDVRRNSLEAAMKVCLQGGLQGIVSEVKGVFRNPGAVNKIKDAKLSLLTYGKLNNVSEAVYMQHLMGIDGVIVDLVQEITEAVSDLIKPSKIGEEEEGGDGEMEVKSKPQFSQRELSFLLKLIPELIQH